jgi:hypothetical protein
VKAASHLENTLLVDGATSLGAALTVTGAATMNNGMTVNGTSTHNGALVVSGASSVGGALAVTGATTMNSAMNVKGASRLEDVLVADGAVSLGSSLAVAGNSSLAGTLAVTGASVLTGALDVKAASHLENTLLVDGAASLGSSLTVTGASILNNTLAVTGAASMASSLAVTGAATLSSSLAVAGAASVVGAMDVTGASRLRNSAQIDGAASMNSTLAVTGAASLSNTLAVTGAASMASTLDVTGASRLRNNVVVDGTASMGSSLAVTGAASMASSLAVTGAASLNNTLAVAGAANMNNTLAVSGAASMASTLAVTGAASLNSTLAVTGAASLNNSLAVIGAASMNNTLAVSGAAALASTLAVTGAATFQNNVTVNGNLTVLGSQTAIDTTSLQVKDNAILLADGNTADVLPLGVQLQYKPSGASVVKYAGVKRLPTTGEFVFFKDSVTKIDQAQEDPVPYVYMPFNNSLADVQGNSTITLGPSPISYVPGPNGDYALNLTNSAAGTAEDYIRGTWAGSPNFTISMWVNIKSHGGSQQVFSAYGGNLVLVLADGAMYWTLPSGGVITEMASPSLLVNTWYHFVCIFQTDGLCSMYLNGQLAASITNVGGLGSQTTTRFSLGGMDHPTWPGYAFNGYIDELRIYNSAIPTSFISTLSPGPSFPIIYPNSGANAKMLMGDDNGQPWAWGGGQYDYAPNLQAAIAYVKSVAPNAVAAMWSGSQTSGGGRINWYVSLTTGGQLRLANGAGWTAIQFAAGVPGEQISSSSPTDVYATLMADGFNCASDARLKKDVISLDSALDKIDAIRGVQYSWIDAAQPQERQIGVIAQEIQAVYPELVREGGNGYLSVDYPKLTAVLIQSVKELKELIMSLANK